MPTLYDPTWDPDRSHDPEYVWRHLANGNTRFVAGEPLHPRIDDVSRHALLGGQVPHAAVLGCCDSRVPPELVFDQGLGDLFTVRSAGLVLGDVVLGSLEFAARILRVPLIVVLGHQYCGAVRSARELAERGHRVTGHVAAIVDGIAPEALAALPEEADALQARATVERVLEESPLIRAAITAGRTALVGAFYSLDTGEVRRLT